jgi:hypothetical protein
VHVPAGAKSAAPFGREQSMPESAPESFGRMRCTYCGRGGQAHAQAATNLHTNASGAAESAALTLAPCFCARGPSCPAVLTASSLPAHSAGRCCCCCCCRASPPRSRPVTQTGRSPLTGLPSTSAYAKS